MGQHGPEAAQRLGGNAGSQRRDVALQVRAEEVPAPERAGRLVRGQEASRESSAGPEALRVGPLHLPDVQRVQGEVANPSG